MANDESSRSDDAVVPTAASEDRELLVSWGLEEPDPARVALEAELLNVEQGDEAMLVWVRFPRNDAPPITAYPPPPRPAERPGAYVGWISAPMAPASTTVERRQAVGLPPQPFLYTLDQIAQLIQRTRRTVTRNLHFAGVSPGKCPKDMMLASNLARTGEPPDWRVADTELIRWLRYKGFKVYDAWSLTHE